MRAMVDDGDAGVREHRNPDLVAIYRPLP